MNNNIAESILQSVDLCIDKKLEKSAFDKTIQANIITIEDESKGLYKIKYQDSTFYATASNKDIKFADGAAVYILIPGGDMTKSKTILGAVTNLGEDFLGTATEEDYYEEIGDNFFNGNDSNEYWILQGSEGENDIDCRFPGFEHYDIYKEIEKDRTTKIIQNLLATENSHYLYFKGFFRTELTESQKNLKPNYGVNITLSEYDEKDRFIRLVAKTTLDIDKMIGSPYDMIVDTPQYCILDINPSVLDITKNYKINVQFFSTLEEHNTIYLRKDIRLCAAQKLSDEFVDSINIYFSTKEGYSIYEKNNIINLTAYLKQKGNIIKGSNQNPITYHWLIKDPSMTDITSEFYFKEAGRGWRLLEGKKATDNPLIYNTTYKAPHTTFKCVAIYNGIAYSLTAHFTVPNTEATDPNNSKLKCFWSYINYQGDTIDISTELEDFSQESAKKKTFNKVDIYNYNTYTVTFYLPSNASPNEYDIVGQVSKTVEKVDENRRLTYYLDIINGEQVFKYDADGISPNNNKQLSPQTLYPLGIKLTNSFGEVLIDTSDIMDAQRENLLYANWDIDWQFPVKNNLIYITSPTGSTESWDLNPSDPTTNASSLWLSETVEFEPGKNKRIPYSLTFNIANQFFEYSNNNTITLKITNKQNREQYIATTSLIFIKDGELGTNGTSVFAKIRAFKEEESTMEVLYPYYATSTINGGFNFDYLQVDVFDKDQNITNTEAVTSIDWEFLEMRFYDGLDENDDPVYTYIYESFYSVTPHNEKAILSLKNNARNKIIASFQNKEFYNVSNLLQVKVNVKASNGQNYTIYDCIPIGTINSTLERIIIDNIPKYVQYNSNGKIPIYNVNPLSIEFDDIFFWDTTFTNEDNTTKDINIYKITNTENYILKPAERYNGSCLSNAIIMLKEGINEPICLLHMPVYLYLNRYGLANLNEWNGNNVKINDTEGYILSPQIGAGIKENDNSFTGILMGEVQTKRNTDVGLLGYSRGERSIFLNAEDGSAEFGFADTGQIKIIPNDPTKNNHSIITGGNYTKPSNLFFPNVNDTDKTGLEIDLTEPSITFGNSNFYVRPNGFLYAKGGGNIAGWEINDTALTKNEKNENGSLTIGLTTQNQGENKIVPQTLLDRLNEQNAPDIISKSYDTGNLEEYGTYLGFYAQQRFIAGNDLNYNLFNAHIQDIPFLTNLKILKSVPSSGYYPSTSEGYEQWATDLYRGQKKAEDAIVWETDSTKNNYINSVITISQDFKKGDIISNFTFQITDVILDRNISVLSNLEANNIISIDLQSSNFIKNSPFLNSWLKNPPSENCIYINNYFLVTGFNNNVKFTNSGIEITNDSTQNIKIYFNMSNLFEQIILYSQDIITNVLSQAEIGAKYKYSFYLFNSSKKQKENQIIDDFPIFWITPKESNQKQHFFVATRNGNLLCNYARFGNSLSDSNAIFIRSSTSGDITDNLHNSSYPSIYSNSKSYFYADSPGFYLGTDGFSIGKLFPKEVSDYGSIPIHSAFQIDSQGQAIFDGGIYAKTGYLGEVKNGFRITENGLFYYDSDNNLVIKENYIGGGIGKNIIKKEDNVFYTQTNENNLIPEEEQISKIIFKPLNFTKKENYSNKNSIELNSRDAIYFNSKQILVSGIEAGQTAQKGFTGTYGTLKFINGICVQTDNNYENSNYDKSSYGDGTTPISTDDRQSTPDKKPINYKRKFKVLNAWTQNSESETALDRYDSLSFTANLYKLSDKGVALLNTNMNPLFESIDTVKENGYIETSYPSQRTDEDGKVVYQLSSGSYMICYSREGTPLSSDYFHFVKHSGSQSGDFWDTEHNLRVFHIISDNDTIESFTIQTYVYYNN